ncbi:hypothetical protein Y717_20335 [Streptomyces scopuliridis RB72]|uniref:Uncharacterized protein n=1 Tax=Streptomyces scopuliridis RB72 TaxID=1440053 RepID=A0A2T7SZ07_9ACTN|nr:hypothetical protein Y717_20335 [Streptomyces scopuliridis RB72]
MMACLLHLRACRGAVWSGQWGVKRMCANWELSMRVEREG